MTAATAATAAGLVADRLEEAAIDHAIGGALAVAAYGVPRMTTDADLGLFLDDDGLPVVYDALERAGCLFDRAASDASIARASFFTVRCRGVYVDLFVAFHSHHHEARGRRRRILMADGRERWFLSPEDLAIHKLAMLRPKDLMDLENLFAAQAGALDVGYIRGWVERIAPDPGDRRRAALEDLARRFQLGSKNEK